MVLNRHDMVTIDPAAWTRVIDLHPDVRAIPLLADWALLGRPLVSRQRMCTDDRAMAPLGLPLPPTMGKLRLSIAAPYDVLVEARRPPRLADISVAPVAWRPTIASLISLDAEARCFGSLAWEEMTRLPYLSTTSDLDLLCHASTPTAADVLAAALSRIASDAPMSVDGEIVTSSGIAVQWREWGSSAPRLLTKTRDGSRLVNRDQVFA